MKNKVLLYQIMRVVYIVVLICLILFGLHMITELIK
jgi:hypothetical protein